MTALARTLNVAHGSCNLRDLLRGLISDSLLLQVPDVVVTDLSLDSHHQIVGSVFLAVPGIKKHGVDYAVQAVKNGARVVLWQPTQDRTVLDISSAACIAIPGLNQILGELADRFFMRPSSHLQIAAITGTNGKSTTAYVLASAAQCCGIEAGYSGTVGYGRIPSLHPVTHTTADVVTLHRQLADMCAMNAGAVAMEVSSHALDQNRIASVRIDTAVFTNLSRDHLDYHGTMEAYAAAKQRLFSVPGLRHRVLNVDDNFGRKLAALATTASITTLYGAGAAISSSRYVHASSIEVREDGMRLQLGGSFGMATLHSNLLGRFNAENLMAALCVLLGWDVPILQAVQALSQASAPPGRMELLKANNKRVVVDYAHTPDALQKTLQVLKAHCRGRLICVFGCGGDRDSGKRALMGAVAATYADQVVLTNDNPRNEDPAMIVAAIQAGMGAFPVIVQTDRALAIEQAIELAQPGDMVLIAGKGHEDYQIIGDQVLSFSDRAVAQSCLRGSI